MLFSWSNELFEKLYEPVSAIELKRKRQMKQLQTQLKSIAPDLDRYLKPVFVSISFQCLGAGTFFHRLSALAPSKKGLALSFWLLGAVFLNFFYLLRLKFPLKRPGSDSWKLFLEDFYSLQLQLPLNKV